MKISVTLFRLYIKWSLVLKHVCAGGGGGNATFGVYIWFPAKSVVSVRHSGPLWWVRQQRCLDSLVNIERQTLGAPSGPRVLLGRSW